MNSSPSTCSTSRLPTFGATALVMAGWFVCLVLSGNTVTNSHGEESQASVNGNIEAPGPGGNAGEEFKRPDIDWSEAEKMVVCSTMVSYGAPSGPTGHWSGWNSGDSQPAKIVDTATNRRQLQMLYHPMIGAYDNKDPKTIKFQMDMADRMGIDAWAIWYWPPLDDASQVHHDNMKLYMDFVEQHNRSVKICGVIDVAFFPLVGPFNPDDVVQRIEDYLKAFADRPSYFRYQGHPVVYFFPPSCKEFTVEQWDYVLKKVRSDGYDPVCFLEIGFDWYDFLVSNKATPGSTSQGDEQIGAYVPEYEKLMEIFDGVFNMSHIGFGHLKEIDRFEAWSGAMKIAREKNCLFMPNPAAGYRTYQWVKPPDPVFEVPRKGGEHYSECWNDAINVKAKWIFLHTWNEWFEHTQLEPALEYGYRYVDLTRKWGDALRR